jgi:hypothetical protein
MSNLSKPMGIALIVCDEIIEDRHTGKKTLVGLFSRIHAKAFPAVHPKMNLFISFDNAKGHYHSAIRIIREKTSEIIAEAKGEITVKSPIDVTEMNIAFINLKFPETGVYNIEFYCEDELVLQRRFVVADIPPQQKKRG